MSLIPAVATALAADAAKKRQTEDLDISDQLSEAANTGLHSIKVSLVFPDKWHEKKFIAQLKEAGYSYYVTTPEILKERYTATILIGW